MAGFLSAYSGTERIDVGGGYWIEIKTCLSRADTEVAERLLSTATTVRDGNGERVTDTAGYRTFMVAASIVDWNLDDEDGAVWVVNNDAAKRRNVARLPESVFTQVFLRVDELNGQKPTPQHRRDFRDRGDERDPLGHGGSAELGEVRLGESTVAAPGTALG